jgi:hypothetical protein
MKDENSLAAIVGQKTYQVWTDMLKALVPEGRTHRLAPLIAGMLQYSFSVAQEKYGEEPDEDTAAFAVIRAAYGDDPEEISEHLTPLLVRLFEDAGAAYERTSSRGEGYSIIESAVDEFFRWFDMPWEG